MLDFMNKNRKSSERRSAMRKRKSKISVKVSLYIALLQVVVMLCLFLVISFSVTQNMKKTTIDNMQTMSIDRARIIEDYIRSSEEFLTAYSRAGEVNGLLKTPTDAEAVAEAQRYTETFSADRKNLEGIYICDWGSTVLAHTNQPVAGRTLREGDALKALQDAMLAADGVYNTGIMMSPASGEQVISMYRACYDGSGTPAGYVGGAIFTTEMFEEINALPKSGLEGSRFYLVNAETGEYIYHDEKEKVATVAEEDYILNILNLSMNHPDETMGYVEYETEKGNCLAAYYSISDKNWVFIMEDSTKEIFASSQKIEVLLMVICVLAAIGITALSFMILLMTFKPLTGINGAVSRLGDGDISDSSEITGYLERTDELGQISRAVKDLQNHLKDVVSEITQKAMELDDSNQEFSERFEEIHAAISGINNAVEDIAVGASGQAQDTLEAKNEVKAIAKEVNENSENVAHLDSAVSATTELFVNMTKILGDLTEISEKTVSSIDEVSEKTKATNQSSDKIREAVDIIKNIASQTNLLSLNASIEAARAGEAGRGFAVVADEIRTLADSSTQSAEDIEKLVDDLVNNSDTSIAETIKLDDVLEKQKEELKLTIQGFENLKNEIMLVASASERINGSNERIEGRQKALDGIVENLSAISEENAAGCEHTKVTMETVSEDINMCNEKIHVLAELSESLKAQVSYFQL